MASLAPLAAAPLHVHTLSFECKSLQTEKTGGSKWLPGLLKSPECLPRCCCQHTARVLNCQSQSLQHSTQTQSDRQANLISTDGGDIRVKLVCVVSCVLPFHSQLG